MIMHINWNFFFHECSHFFLNYHEQLWFFMYWMWMLINDFARKLKQLGFFHWCSITNNLWFFWSDNDHLWLSMTYNCISSWPLMNVHDQTIDKSLSFTIVPGRSRNVLKKNPNCFKLCMSMFTSNKIWC